MAFPILTTEKGWHEILLEDGREGWIADTAVRVARDSRGIGVVSPPLVPAVAPTVAPVSEQVVGRRMALVIGNASYDVGPLKNPVNDATDMAAALQRLGFTVTRRLNANQAEMESVIEAFGQQLRQGGGGLFYFASHGLQVGGENYLMPIGARINREQDVKIAAVHVGRVLGAMEDAKNDLNIVILDACRNNPFARGFRSQVQGLAPVDAARGSLIAYATAPGSVASDGSKSQWALHRESLTVHEHPWPECGADVQTGAHRCRANDERTADAMGVFVPYRRFLFCLFRSAERTTGSGFVANLYFPSYSYGAETTNRTIAYEPRATPGGTDHGHPAGNLPGTPFE
jgi:Caspase domain